MATWARCRSSLETSSGSSGEDYLDSSDRRRIRRAVRRGESIEEPGLASLAVSLARRRQAIHPVAIVLYGLVLMAWAALLIETISTNLPLSGRTVVAWLTPIAWLILIPLRLVLWLLVQRPRYRRAEKENLAVADTAGGRHPD